MNASNSNLTDSRYGYDFVVSTTQASINSGLLEYLWESNQPVNYVCYLLDPNTGNATTQISLEELLKRTNGVNPFDILDCTPASDPRVEALTQNNFAVGVKIRIGVPPGKIPKELPPILELGKSGGKSLFRMFCSEFQVIQNISSCESSINGSWNVWDQPSGSPWYIETAVDVVKGGLDRNLETPYFNQHPELKRNLQAQLTDSFSSTSFSLQQTLLDLENAAYHSAPNFVGIPAGSHALEVLQKSFIDLYSKAAKSYGEPLLAVTAVTQDSEDHSQLKVTSLEVGISRYKDSNTQVINDPTPDQAAATTLSHLCMTDGHGAPAFSDPYWNWVQPGEVKNESGVIAIKRAVFAEQLIKTILPLAMKSCMKPQIKIKFTDFWGDWEPDLQFISNQTPQKIDIRSPDNEAWIIDITWSAENDPGVTSSNSEHGFFDTLTIIPHYTCEVFTWDSTIKIQQHLWIYLSVRCQGTNQNLTGYDVTITDFYDLSVDQTGRLKISRDPNRSQREDKSQEPNASWITNMFAGVNDAVKQIKEKIQGLVKFDLESFDFATPQNFVFPGGKVFTYTSAKFSKHQDLICDITYASPNESFQPPPQADIPISDQSWGKPATDNGQTPTSKPPETASPPSYSMTHTTELIQNYIQGEIVSPTEKFEALQTDDGHSLLFALSTDNVLNVIMEQSGTTKTGWVRTALSSGFSSVRTFDVGQSVTDGTIGMALVVSEGGSDQLFLSLFNSSSDTSWTAKPNWSLIPFDAEGHTGPVDIIRVMFAEPQGSQQHIIVDTLRSSNKADKEIDRYYVDPQKSSGRFWTSHSLPVDVQQSNYQTCVGRVAKGFIDGVYTIGIAGGSAQLVYVPIENAFGDGPPLPCRLILPQDTRASSIAAARRPGTLASPDGTTDLFAVGNSTLYYFPAERQTDMSVATQLLSSDVFSGTSELAAMTREGVTTIWGKNACNEVYYISCPSNQLSNQNAWSVPVPILFGVERMTPYLNRRDGGKAIFTSGSGKLERLTQATGTDAKMWVADEIKLQAAERKTRPLSFKSYTTTIHVLDKHDLPAPDVKLSISTSSQTPVYINGTYYVLGQASVTVTTDACGCLTIIEALQDSINGTLMTVICNGGDAQVIINPMEKSFQTIAALNSEGALRDAKVATNTVAGGIRGNPTWTALVEKALPAEVTAAADSLSRLGTTYGLVKPTVSSGSCMSVIPHTLYKPSSSDSSLVHDVAIAAGDLFRWLKSDSQRVVKVIKDDASGAWHFVATIADKVYRAALTSVDAIVGAAEWVFKNVKTDIKKLMGFVEFLFDWDDIERTKNVFYNMTRQWLRGQVDYLHTAKTEFDGQIAHAEKSIEKWAGITDWGSPLGSKASQPAAASGTNPAKAHTSGSQMMITHFKNHVADTEVVGTLPKMNVASEVVNDLLEALDKEEQTMSNVYTQLQKLSKNFRTKTVGEVLKDLAGIIALGVLSSVQIVIDALFDVLVDVADDVIGLLDTKIHIPVISDILNDVGIPDISYMDLICWLPSFSYTVIYKIAHQKAPFAADDAEVQAFIAADSWGTMQAILRPDSSKSPVSESLGIAATHRAVNAVPKSANASVMPQQLDSACISETSPTSISSFASTRVASTAPTSPASLKSPPSPLAERIYQLGHFVGSCTSIMSIFVDAEEASLEPGNPLAMQSACISVVGGVSSSIADFAVPRDPIQSTAAIKWSYGILGVRFLSILFFTPFAQGRLEAYGAHPVFVDREERPKGAKLDAIIAIPAVFVTLEHFCELYHNNLSLDATAAVLGKLTNVASYVSRICYGIAVNINIAVEREEPIKYMSYANAACAALEAAQGAVPM